jgi:general secretion pathway protein B
MSRTCKTAWLLQTQGQGNSAMSYILDALKKAESERKLGSVPDLHAQPVASLTMDDKAVLWRRPWGWGVLLALLVILSALAWTKPWQTATSPAAKPLLPETTAPKIVTIRPSLPLEQQATITRDAAISSAPSAPVFPATTATSTRPVAVGVALPPAASSHTALPSEPVKPQVESRLASKSAEKQQLQPASSSEALPLKKTGATAPAAPSPETGVPTLNELPEVIRREIPSLAFGGYLYSNSPADRTVLINNRLLREGDQVAPGLTLEKMTPKEAILNYLGYRYRVSY